MPTPKPSYVLSDSGDKKLQMALKETFNTSEPNNTQIATKAGLDRGTIAKIRNKQDTLWLIDTIIDNSNEQLAVVEYFDGDDLLTPLQRRRGLPVGNLTSQFFANVYLNSFDHFVKEQLKVRKYLRYVHDFALFSDDWGFLAEVRLAIEEHLANLRLKIHPIKSQLSETKHGANFVGFRIFPDRIRVRTENLRRARRRLKKMQSHYTQGKISLEKVSQSIQSWFAHLEHGDTWQLRQQIFASLAWTRG